MIIVAGRTLACVLVCGFCAVLSNVLNSYVLILAGGLLPAAAEFALYKINFSGVDVFAKNVNLFSFGGGYLLKRYYSVRLFGCADAYVATYSAPPRPDRKPMMVYTISLMLRTLIPETCAASAFDPTA